MNLKLNNIQALRAYAAIMVAIFHTNFVFPHTQLFGSFGVDTFFVISGYIMARILDPRSSSSSDFFFRRRLLRIVPPYWFFTICLFCVAYFIPQLMGATRANGIELLKSLLFIPFTKQNGAIQPVLFLGWTLNFEMFFYLSLALGLLITRRFASWAGSIIVLTVMLCSAPFAGHSVVARFYSNHVVIDFVFGVICYYMCRAIHAQAARRYRIPLLLVCITCAILLVAFEAVGLHIDRVLTLGISSFFLVGSASLLSLGEWDINLSWVVLIGDASYILYLVHPYCESSVDRILARRIPAFSMTTPLGAFITVCLSIVVAVLIHIYCERPTVRFLYSRFGGKRKSIEFFEPGNSSRILNAEPATAPVSGAQD